MKKLLFTIAFAVSLPLCAQETNLVFGPSDTAIHWILNTRLHTVHGTFRLKEGNIRFDRATGKASGEIVVDAQSGESGSSMRDSRMHSAILETKLFPAIVFVPDHVNGQIPAQGDGKLELHGTFQLHGKSHEFTMPVEVNVEPAQIAVKSHFNVPYIAWGLKNPSTLFLKVDDTVAVELTATGHLKQ